MIIAIDGYEANISQRVGIGRYAFEIISHMYKLCKIHRPESNGQNLLFKIYLPTDPQSHMPNQTDWWQYRIAKPVKFWTLIGFPMALAKDSPRADVIFSPTHYVPRFTCVKRVMSIMDLSYMKFPQLFKSNDMYKLTNWTRYSVSHTDRIFTISEASKRDIINAYQVQPEKVVVTYPGIETKNIKMSDKSEITHKYKISSNFILAVGTLQPRKNYIKLIEAFSIFLRQNKQRFESLQLVIVGKKGWMYDEIIKAPQKFGVSDQVKFLDFVDDSDLPALYKNAICYVLPSLYEGFGLPVAEAMSFGCPVVVSNNSSLPEIAGKAGIYIDPENPTSIAEGMLTAVRQRNLIQGRQRIKTGFEQVKKFSWEKAARETLRTLIDVGTSR
jgi:glycosyltransferase involved in cell wall biosynthesis